MQLTGYFFLFTVVLGLLLDTGRVNNKEKE